MNALIQKMHLISVFICIMSVVLFMFVPPAAAQEWSSFKIETDADLHSIYFTDRYNGWVIGDEGTIFFTSDGGETWTRQNSRTLENLNRVFFFDEFTGWIAGANNLILATHNGGEQWTERRPSPVANQHILDIHFADWKRGWAAGGPGGHIYYTDNSGLSWQRQANLTRDSTITSIHFEDHHTGYVLYGNRIHHTSRAGSDWSENYPLTELDTFQATGFAFADDTVGLAIGNHQADGVILSTTDGGKVWNEMKRLPDRQLLDITFRDDKSGYVTGSRGTLLRTDDRGNSWTTISTETETGLNGIHFTDPGSGWIAGDSGTLFRLLDSQQPDISYYKKNYPSVEIANETEARELLERSERYGNTALEKENPEKRSPNYGRMVAAIEEAEPFFEEGHEIIPRISRLKQYFWGNEYNAGAELFNQSLEQENSRELAEMSKLHLQNAVFIEPDSINSHLSLAYVNEFLGNFSSAISSMEQAIGLMEVPEIEHLTYLIDLYISEERISEAIGWVDYALEHYPEEDLFYEMGVDLYLEIGETEKAINRLTILIKNNPVNADYHYARGSQMRELALSNLESALELYKEVGELREKLYLNLPQHERQTLVREIQTRMEEVNKLEEIGTDYANRAVSDLEMFTDLQQDSKDAYGMLGTLFYNGAAVLQEMRRLTRYTDESQRFLSRINDFLISAKTYLEQAVDKNPEIESLWIALYNTYLSLDMVEEASQIIEEGRI